MSSESSEIKNIAVLGGAGHFAFPLERDLVGRRFNVRCFDASRWPHELPEGVMDELTLKPAVEPADVIMLSTPPWTYEDIAKKLVALDLERKPLVVGLTSDMVSARSAFRFLNGHLPWINTHPLFGPPSVQFLAEGDYVAIQPGYPAGGREEAYINLMGRLFGLEFIEIEPEAHNKAMAPQQALGSIVALAVRQSEMFSEGPYQTTLGKALEEVNVIADSESKDLLKTFTYPGAAKTAITAFGKMIEQMKAGLPLANTGETRALSVHADAAGLFIGNVLLNMGYEDHFIGPNERLLVPSGKRLMRLVDRAKDDPDETVEILKRYAESGYLDPFISHLERQVADAVNYSRTATR